MKKTINRIFSYLREFKIHLLISVLLTVIISLIEILTPKLMGNITTSIFDDIKNKSAVNMDYVIKICVILIILYILLGFLNYVVGVILVKVSQKMMFNLREDISKKVKKINMSYFDKNKVGDLLSRMTNDVETLGKNLNQSINNILSGAILIVGIIAVMLSISKILSLVFFITLPLSYYSTKFIAKKSQGYFRKKSKGLGDMVGYVEENFQGFEVVKAYNYEEISEKEFLEINENLYEVSYKASFMTGIMLPIMTFISNLGYVLICIVGGFLVVRGNIFIGDIQAIIQYVRKLSMPIEQIAEMANIFQASIAAGDRIFEFLDAEEEENIVKYALSRPVNEIEFKNVDFSYDKKENVIDDLNLVVDEKSTVAIVGKTGAGKTTLVNLLMRFYDVDKGAILINGKEVRFVDRKNLRELFGMVLQDTWLFPGTIYENVAYGKLDATEEEVIRACKESYCHNFIMALPKGYDTVLNEEASNISGGQKQLLTIARAFLSDPEILILDEATSSVDTRTESLIQKAMANLLKDRTSFIIAHRLSTIVGADTILVMDKGDIVEKGNHKELIEKRGIYYNLYNSQFMN